MMPTAFEYPHDVLLGMLRVGGVPDKGDMWARVSHALPRWSDPTPECMDCGDPSVASVTWCEIRSELQPVLSQASLERGPEYLELPVDHDDWFFCHPCAYAVISDVLAHPDRDRTATVTVEVSGWWIASTRKGGVG